MTSASLPTSASYKSGPLLILGAGDHAAAVTGLARSQGFDVIGYTGAPGDPPYFRNLPVKPLEDWPSDIVVALGVGNPVVRRRLLQEAKAAGRNLIALIHTSAVVDSSAIIGEGTVVFPLCVVGIDVQLGPGVILNSSSVVEHESAIAPFAHISCGAVLGGAVKVGEGTWVGLGASVIQHVTIGDWSMIGAGATVVNDIPDGVVAVGTPARVTKQTRYFAERSNK